MHRENAGLILTPAELLELTSYKQPAAQARWLEHNGFTYRVAANGRVVVLREHTARILDGAHDATVVAVPDFSWVNYGRRRQKSNGLPARVYRKHGAHYYVGRDNTWHRLGKHWDATARKMWLELDAGTPRAGTVASLLNAFMASPRRNVLPRTQADNEHEKLALVRSLGHCTLESVKPTTIAQYLEKRGAPVRANREISLLSRAFSWAVARALADRNPCLGVERNKEQSRKRLPSVAEIETVAAKGGAIVAAGARLAYLTGQATGADHWAKD